VGLKYLALIGSQIENINQNLLFIPEVTDLPMEVYAAAVQDNIKASMSDLTSLTEEFLTTSSGIDYFRWVIERTQNNIEVRQVIYVVANGDWKLSIIYTRQAGAAPEQDAVIDVAIDTLQFGL
jgi:hypothetical protein